MPHCHLHREKWMAQNLAISNIAIWGEMGALGLML